MLYLKFCECGLSQNILLYWARITISCDDMRWYHAHVMR